MFRIESYITPIILSHIDKYVQDFRPKDAQVSLWGGEVAFQNLDLRLDVLEEELQLPFCFVSGHIHELTIRVPWTKIASEPIQITINTIEFVLKLRTADDPPPPKVRKKSRADLTAAAEPPGYMASLVNKIANNISVKMHNVILKYVEDDIVVSMNIQLLRFDSANEMWQPDFVDISPTKVLLKKVINIADLTICLDKRNTMGIIDICQEPMLYRCSLQVRLLRRYNIASAHKTSLLRMDIFTDAVELNVSAQQYPMLLRLLELATALRDGRMQAATAAAAAAAAAELAAAGEGTTADADADAEGNDEDAGASMISWAWNMLPTLFPVEAYEEEHVARKLGHILHTGLYVNKLTVTFKSQELIGDNITNAAKKLKYHPLLRVALCGLYTSTVTVGRRWFNATGGISHISILPLGTCVCGAAHGSDCILRSADILSTHAAHLDGSLWDCNSPEYRDEVRSYDRIWESHASRVPMAELQRRTPAMAFDVAHEVDGDDMDASGSATSSNLPSNLEYSNLSESYECRASVGEFHCTYNTSAVHIAQRLREYAQRYDYAPYAAAMAAMTREQLSPPAADDYEALMADVPMRRYHISIQRPVFEFHLAVHDGQPTLPVFVLEMETVGVRCTAPFYPNRLVYTTCLLPEPPAKLYDACHTRYTLEFQSATVSLRYPGGKAVQSCHLKLANTELNYSVLIYPQLWLLETRARSTMSLIAESCTVYANKPQVILLHCLAESVRSGQPVKAALFETSVLADTLDTALPVVDVSVHRVLARYSVYSQMLGYSGSVNSIQGLVYIPKAIESVGFIESHKHKAIFLTDDQAFPEVLAITIQIPDTVHARLAPAAIPTLVAVSLGSLLLNVDPLLCEFLGYRFRAGVATVTAPSDAAAKTATEPRSQLTLNSESSETEVEPDSSLVQIFPVDRVIPLVPKTNASPFANIRQMYMAAKQAAITVECRPCTLYVPDRSLRMRQRDSKLRDVVKAATGVQMATVRLPLVTLRSAHDATVLAAVLGAVQTPILLATPSTTTTAPGKGARDGFPWSLTLSGVDGSTTLSGVEQPFLEVQRTTVTVAVTMKSAKKHEPSFVIHSDTAPITLHLTEPQVMYLQRASGCLQSLASAQYTLAGSQSQRPAHIEISARPASPGNQANDLKDFLGTVNPASSEGTNTTTKESSPSDVTATDGTDGGGGSAGSDQRLSIWMQWTLSKVGVNLYGGGGSDSTDIPRGHLKFLLEMEDIISSFDQQDVYTKVRFKAGTLTGVCQTRDTPTDAWRKLDGLGLIARNTLSDSLEETFVEVTVTRALTKNVHGRWFSRLRKKQNKQLINTISEVMVTVQSIDVTVDPDVLAGFLPLIAALAPKETPSGGGRREARVLSVRDCPIFYLKSEGVRVFFPQKLAADESHPPRLTNPACDVFFLKITRISITPSTDNPLYRKPIRGDIYTKAMELNILNVPGSSVENRQYEITLHSISLSSGRWEQIREHLEPSLNAVKNAHKKNPAFDWNNLTVKPSVEIRAIFERFNLTVVFAPCIVFENLLVCGQCLEVNCLTDLIVVLHTHELLLLHRLVAQMQQLAASAVFRKPKTSRVSHSVTRVKDANAAGVEHAVPVAQVQRPHVEHAVTDSGVESMEPRMHRRTTSTRSKLLRSADFVRATATSASSLVPYDVAFVAGIFNVKVFHSLAQALNAAETSNDATDGSAAASSTAAAHPLISFTVFQPNVLISQTPIEKTSQVSLFNLIVRLGPELDEPNPNGGGVDGAGCDFDDIVFTTLPGVPNRFGIPQPLLHISKNVLPGGLSHFEVNVNRPNVLNVSHHTLRKLQKLQQIFGISERPQTTPAITKAPTASSSEPLNSFRTLRKRLFDADRIVISLDATTIECSSDRSPAELPTTPDDEPAYSITFGWSHITSTIELLTRQQRVRMDTRVQAMALHAGHGIVLHPTTVRTIAVFTKESWKKQPLCSLHVRSTCVDVAVGPNCVLHLQRMQAAMGECMPAATTTTATKADGTTVQDETLRPAGDESLLADVELVAISTPKISRDELGALPAEYYQDDLRAGAFQFIESTSAGDVMPLPYEIQITSRDGGGVICWRYPQPRVLHFVQVFPVLMTMRRHQEIRCELQYFSAVHRCFQAFAEFRLSDRAIQQLRLPERPIIAEMWRVLIHQAYVSVQRQHFQGSDDGEPDAEDEDEEEYDDEDDDDVGYSERRSRKTIMNLQPGALVACIRIDSKFHAQLAPNFEFALQMEHFCVSLRHDEPLERPARVASSMPSPLRQCTLDKSNGHELQTLVKLSQRQVRVYCGIYDDMVWAVTAETRVGCTVLDMGYLSMQPLLDECLVKAEVSSGSGVSGGTNTGPVVNVVADLLRLRYGQCVGYTLTLAQQLWLRVLGGSLDGTASAAPAVHIPLRYVLCNCTATAFGLGQVDTDEWLALRSNECLPYAFRSVRAEQRLRLTVDAVAWTFEPAVPMATTESTHTLCMPYNEELLVVSARTQRSGVAGSQVVVTLRGQVEFRNMTGQEFRVQYRESAPDGGGGGTAGTDGKTLFFTEAELKANACMSLVASCDAANVQRIRLQLQTADKKSWTGDIPLHQANRSTPWLVKVPTHTKQQFSSYWVRALREDIIVDGAPSNPAAKPQRMLIVIWPFLVVRSLLPVNVTAYDRSTDTLYQLAGRGERPVELNVPGTHETEHEITFDTNSFFKTTTKLSYQSKALRDLCATTDDDANLSLDESVTRIDHPPAVHWPCRTREEERRWLRNISQLEPMHIAFNRLPSQPLSASQMLDVVPPCLLINSVGSTMQLINTDNTATMVHPNNVAMPATVTSQFTLSFLLNNSWHPTCPILLTAQPQRGTRPQIAYELPDEGTAIVKLLSEHALSKYQLSSTISHGVRVLIVAPHFVFANHTDHTLSVWAFCVLQRQHTELPPDDNKHGSFTAAPQRTRSGSARGIGINTFYNLSHDPNDGNFRKLFNFFVTIRIGGAAFSVPIPLNRAVQRSCFSIDRRTGANTTINVPLSLSIVEHNGQMFVSVYPDDSPCIRLINQTSQRLHVAQAESADATPAVPMRALSTDDQFDWHASVAAGRSIFYTPPGWDAAFPERESGDISIMFAVANEGRQMGGWCRPFGIFQPLDALLDLPTAGDVRIAVNCGQRTIDVTVSQIDHSSEFNVKDIRTKLLRPVAATTAVTPKPLQGVRTAAQPLPRVIPPPDAVSPPNTDPLTLNLFMQGVHLTLYTDDEHQHCLKTELMAIYLNQIALRYSATSRTFDLRLCTMQIDNQLHATGCYDFPVLLCMQESNSHADNRLPKPSPPPAPHAIDDHVAGLYASSTARPALSVVALFRVDHSGVSAVDELTVGVQPISAYIEDKYINVMLDFLLENMPANLSASGGSRNGDEDDESGDIVREFCEPGQVLLPRAVLAEALDLSRPCRIRRLRIEPLSVLLSVHTCLRMYIALDHSPLDFGAYERLHVYSQPARIGYALGMHYVSGALFGAGWVVGSLEILGSPSGLARSVTTGLRDFVAMPVEGVMRGPWGLLEGITHGSASLIRHVTAGTVNSVTKLAASVARNLDWLTLDAEHLQRTEALRRHRPRSISEGIAQGLTGLGISLLGAVGGLSRHPLEAQTSLDVVAGLGRGLVGAVTKPISGAAELVALTGQGVLQTVGFNRMPAAREAPMTRVQQLQALEPAAAKIVRKYVPSAYGADEVLFVVVGTLQRQQGGAVCVALCTHLLVVVELETDRLVEMFELERIGVRLDEADGMLVRIGVSGAVDSTLEEQEFQYNRVLKYVCDSSELVMRPLDSEPIRSADLSVTCSKEDLRQKTTAAGVAVAPPPAALATAGAAGAAQQPPEIGIYMDGHLARHLVQYTQLLQRMFMAKSKKMSGK